MRLPWWWPFGSVPEIDATHLADIVRRAEPQILDVRTATEYVSGHIPGAVSTPIQSFRQSYQDLELDPSQPVYVICRTAHRSIPATRFLNAQGFEAYQLTQGMNAWWRHKLPTTRPSSIRH